MSTPGHNHHNYPQERKTNPPSNTQYHQQRFPCPKCGSCTGTDTRYTFNRWLTFQCLKCSFTFKKASKLVSGFVPPFDPMSKVETPFMAILWLISINKPLLKALEHINQNGKWIELWQDQEIFPSSKTSDKNFWKFLP